MSAPAAPLLNLRRWRARCRSSACHAVIVWVRIQPNGNRMPVDYHVNPAGDIAIGLGPDGALIGSVLDHTAAEQVRAVGLPLHLSHFATCPDAARYRRTP